MLSSTFVALLLAQTTLAGDQPGSWGDPSRALFTDPSARSILVGLNGVAFDGLAPGATSFDFDGVTVLQPAQALFGPSSLSAAWSPSLTLSSGVDTAEHGRSLGRRVTLLTRQAPTAGTTNGVVRVDLLHTGLFVEHGFADGSSLQGALRFFTTPAVAGLALKGSLFLGDYQLRWVQKLGDGAELRTQALGTLDSIALTVSGIPLGARLQSHQVDVRYRNEALELSVGVHRRTIGLTLNGAAVVNDIDGVENGVRAKAMLRGRLSEHATGKVGADVELRDLHLVRSSSFTIDLNRTDVTGAASTQRDLGVVGLGGVFGEVVLLDGDWETTLGLRADVWAALNAPAVVTADPRLRTHRRFGSVDVELAAGLTHQAPTWLVSVPVLEALSLTYGVQELARADLTVTLPIAREGKDFVSIHAFGAGLVRGLEFSPFDDDFLQLVNQAPAHVERHRAPGWMAGAELRSHVALREWWWLELSYGYQQAWRDAVFDLYDQTGLPVGQQTAWVPWQHRQTHQVRAAVGFDFGSGWKVALAGTLTSGAPMLGGLYAREQQAGFDSLTGAPRWVPKNRDQVGDAPPYVRADLRASKTWHPGAADVELFLDVAGLAPSQPTGTSYGTAPATLEQQARGDLTLTSKNASSPLPPIPVLGLEIRL